MEWTKNVMVLENFTANNNLMHFKKYLVTNKNDAGYVFEYFS